MMLWQLLQFEDIIRAYTAISYLGFDHGITDFIKITNKKTTYQELT